MGGQEGSAILSLARCGRGSPSCAQPAKPKSAAAALPGEDGGWRATAATVVPPGAFAGATSIPAGTGASTGAIRSKRAGGSGTACATGAGAGRFVLTTIVAATPQVTVSATTSFTVSDDPCAAAFATTPTASGPSRLPPASSTIAPIQARRPPGARSRSSRRRSTAVLRRPRTVAAGTPRRAPICAEDSSSK
jgi:hypothetical protein